jgi:hypothetical protein
LSNQFNCDFCCRFAVPFETIVLAAYGISADCVTEERDELL